MQSTRALRALATDLYRSTDMIKILATVLVLLLVSSPFVRSEESHVVAVVYSTSPIPIDRDLVASFAGTATVTASTSTQFRAYICRWDDVAVAVAVNPEWSSDVQLKWMKSWISRFPEDERHAERVVAMLQTMDSVTNCISCTISPRYDAGGKAKLLVLDLAKALRGFVFSHQTFYDSDGKKIIGTPGDSSILGAKK